MRLCLHVKPLGGQAFDGCSYGRLAPKDMRKIDGLQRHFRKDGHNQDRVELDFPISDLLEWRCWSSPEFWAAA